MSPPKPPRLAEWILHHAASSSLQYGALGDFEQIFVETAETEGLRAANGWYWSQVVRSFPLLVADSFLWRIIMLKNYVQVAYRNLYKNKASSLVNIVGLSVSIAIAITSFLFIERQYTMDWFHENGENIFLVENYTSRGGDAQLRGDTPIPLGPAMQAKIPQIRRAVRVEDGAVTVQVDGNAFREIVRFVDPEFLDLFSFQLRLGDKRALIGHDDVILSAALAEKYFGQENPMGQELALILSENETQIFTVRGVAKPFPNKSSFAFSALVSIDHLADMGIDESDWGTTTSATFIEVGSPADVALVAKQMEDFRGRQNAANENRPISQFEFDNLRSLSTHSYRVSGDISGGTHPASVVVMGLISLFMLLLSCINYTNLAVATASRRLKEIGVRKAIGSSKAQLVGQFLTENVLTCVLALGVGIAVSYFLFTPGFNALMLGGGIHFGDANLQFLWPFLVGLLVFTGLISGAYPALYISSFRPTAIFRGRIDLGGENFFTRGLLTFQFILAFLTMIMGVVLAQNADFQADRDWGYDSGNLLVLRVRNATEFSALRTEIEKLPGVERIVGAGNQFNRSWTQTTLEVEGDHFGASRFDVGDGFLETYDLAVTGGKGFDAASLTEIDGAVLVNDAFVKARGWTSESALHKSFRQDSLTYSVAGVVGNFIYANYFEPVEPAFLRAIPEADYRFMSVKLTPGSGVSSEVAVRGIWKRLVPDREYNGFFQDAVFQDVLMENTYIKEIFTFIAVLALMIACMGLFSLAAQKVARQMREISIRKVLGASAPRLAAKMNRGFVMILLIAAVVASPLGYFAMDALLSSIYSDPVSIGPAAFVISFSLVLGTAVLTISTQVHKYVRANPADVLRCE